jgi:hypothetical protein
MKDPSSTTTLDAPEQRPCSRCDGRQHLAGSHEGLGKFRCDTCELIVGFDLEADPAEFLLHRGLPSRYTKEWFGPRLAADEQRLPSGRVGGRTN